MHMVKRLNSLLALSLCLTVLCGWQQQAAIAVNPGFRIVITDKGLDYGKPLCLAFTFGTGHFNMSL